MAQLTPQQHLLGRLWFFLSRSCWLHPCRDCSLLCRRLNTQLAGWEPLSHRATSPTRNLTWLLYPPNSSSLVRPCESSWEADHLGPPVTAGRVSVCRWIENPCFCIITCTSPHVCENHTNARKDKRDQFDFAPSQAVTNASCVSLGATLVPTLPCFFALLLSSLLLEAIPSECWSSCSL